MRKIHYITIVCLLTVISLFVLYLDRTPRQKDKSISTEVAEKIEETSTSIKDGTQDNGAESIIVGNEREGRILSKEEWRAVVVERTRLSRLLFHELDIDRSNIQEHDINKTIGQFDYLMGGLLDKLMIKKTNERLNVIPHYMFDVRDGEIRFPPHTREYADLLQKLRVLMDKPEQTEEEDARIRQIAWEIYDMVKTNTPTSVFQMPESKEE